MSLSEIYNWHRVNDKITTSGQFTPEQFAKIVDLKVSHIVNLGPHEHEYALKDHTFALPNEETIVKEAGLEYIYLPIDFENPTESDFTDFCNAMKELESKKIHIHCIANFRVSAFLYRYYRDVKKEGAEKAKQDMLSIWQPEGVWAEFIAD